MKALVTGGAGFIGSHLVDRLLQEDYAVCVIDNLSSGKRANLSQAAHQIQFVEGDIRDLATLKKLSHGCDTIFHQAAIVSVPYSIEHPDQSLDVNIKGTLNVLLAAKQSGVRRVVFASSAAVYGEDPQLPKQEHMPTCPCSPYGVEKTTSEAYLQVFSNLYDLETVALRYFNVFGPRQDPSSPYSGVISIFVDRMLNLQTPTIFGDGEQTRDFVFVANVVEANLLAARTPAANGEIYNVGCGQKTSLNQLYAYLCEQTGFQGSPNYQPTRAGDIRDSFADINKARQELGYAPKIEAQEGLRRLVESVRSQR